MSTYVVSMIEVRQGGNWELLRNFRRDDYIACEADGAFPKDLTWEMKKTYLDEGEDEISIGYIENSVFFDENYEFQDFLLDCDRNRGYIENDLGMPDDASPLTVKKYNEYGHNASTPSYFYLLDLMGAWSELLADFKKELPKAQQNDALNEINKKLNILLNASGLKTDKEDMKEGYNDYHFIGALNEILNIRNEICRISTLVEAQYGNLKSTDIRIIWFIY